MLWSTALLSVLEELLERIGEGLGCANEIAFVRVKLGLALVYQRGVLGHNVVERVEELFDGRCNVPNHPEKLRPVLDCIGDRAQDHLVWGARRCVG